MAYPISPTPAQCEVNPCLAGCPEVTVLPVQFQCDLLCNTSFECPEISVPVESVLEIDVPCWETTHKSNNIEIWSGTGNAGPLPHTGNQYIKLPVGDPTNPNRKVYQDWQAVAGQTMIIKFWHAGRVGYLNNMTVSLGRSYPGNLVPSNDPNPIILGNFTAIDNIWRLHTITWIVPIGYFAITALIFESNDSGTGGNFIDDVTITYNSSSVIATSNSPIILGGTINLTASSIPGATYSWVGPNLFTSNLQNPIITNVTSLDGGVYTVNTVTGISPRGCRSSASTTVVILPCDISVTASSNSPVTVGNTLNLTSLPANGVGPYTFLWYGPNGYFNFTQNPSFIVTSLLQAGTYTVEVTDSNDCVVLTTIDVEVLALPCFIITDCNTVNPQPPFTTSTDLIDYDGEIVKFCDAIPGWDAGCYCAKVTRTISCLITTPLPNFIDAILDKYDDCLTCRPYCYLLTDCSDPLHTILVSNDFANYVGLVVKLEGCSTCWEVSQVVNCGNSVCGDNVEKSFANCTDCLPPVLPIPKEELCTRTVKPGYNTPGCPPAYTEKINCNFAEAVYDQMAVVRYGINICCDLDLDILDIKKQELDLRAIFDPKLCETIVPDCTTCDDDCPPVVILPDGTCTTDSNCINGQVCVMGICVNP